MLAEVPIPVDIEVTSAHALSLKYLDTALTGCVWTLCVL